MSRRKLALLHRWISSPEVPRIRMRNNIATGSTRLLHIEPLESRRLLAITVDTLVDELDGSIVDGDISLRDAIAVASSGETINFSVSGTINLDLGLGELLIDKELTISGPGADQLTINGGNGLDDTFNTADGIRIFRVENPIVNFIATISGLTLTGGDVAGDGGGIRSVEGLILNAVSVEANAATQDGGGIYFASPGLGINIELNNSTVAANIAGANGGGLRTDTSIGIGTILNSTISGNDANGDGGGMWTSGAVTLEHSTITGNTSDFDNSGLGSGGGLQKNSGTLVLNHSIVALNIDNSSTAPDANGITSASYSLIGDNANSGIAEAPVGLPDGNGNLVGGAVHGTIDPLLDSLQDNGGSTFTHALLPGSPALDQGDAGFTVPPDFDQRGAGFPRVIGGQIDIGAYEGVLLPTTLTVDTLLDEADGDLLDGDVSLRDAIALAPSGSTIDFSVTGTIDLTLGEMLIDKELTIDGPGADLLIIDAGDGVDDIFATGDGHRIFRIDDGDINNAVQVDLQDITLTGGDTLRGVDGEVGTFGEWGGAIYSFENLTIVDSKIVNNSTGRGGHSSQYSYTPAGWGGFGGGIANGGIGNDGGILTITGSTISGNVTGEGGDHSYVLGNAGSGGFGGGIMNYRGTLVVVDSVISGNSTGNAGIPAGAGYHGLGGSGGGIASSWGAVSVTGTTVSDNVTGESAHVSNNRGGTGGGAYISTRTGAVSEFINSTISGNRATESFGGGVINQIGELRIVSSTITDNLASYGTGSGVSSRGREQDSTEVRDSIIAGNVNDDLGIIRFNSGEDFNSFVSEGYNLVGVGSEFDSGIQNAIDPFAADATTIVGVAPLLGPLADNGGPTQTHALLPGSPALDAANSVELADQRGLTVPVDLAGVANALGGNGSDIGAYEAQAAPSADFVDDDVINGLDFLAWQRGYGLTSGAMRTDGNSDDDGDVDTSDLVAWEVTYGQVDTTPLAQHLPLMNLLLRCRLPQHKSLQHLQLYPLTRNRMIPPWSTQPWHG